MNWTPKLGRPRKRSGLSELDYMNTSTDTVLWKSNPGSVDIPVLRTLIYCQSVFIVQINLLK